MQTTFLLVAATCLTGSAAGYGPWDGGCGCDPCYSYCCPDYGYGSGYGGGYGYGCDYGYGYPAYSQPYGYNPYCMPYWNPYACAPQQKCCHQNCLERLRARHHPQEPPICWGWDPNQAGPSFGCGYPPYGNSGWGSVCGASKASGWWCPDDGCRKEHCHKHLFAHRHHKHDSQPPCFNPSAGPWDGGAGPDACYGGPPVDYGDE